MTLRDEALASARSQYGGRPLQARYCTTLLCGDGDFWALAEILQQMDVGRMRAKVSTALHLIGSSLTRKSVSPMRDRGFGRNQAVTLM